MRRFKVVFVPTVNQQLNSMYTRFFGLKDIPFSIAPNPHFLYMSDRHREALAHLTYGLGETGGFVLLTGEVGTGKTTVSRCLLEQLPENTQAAFILNPTLSAQELLATICDELKIRYRKTGATLKTLTDKIQFKLLKNHEAGLNTILIIDEAQHLQAEVLEQLRLLTNLETHTKKLLQVILIGQPELQELLKRRDLRQLAQRITARYHLLPLNEKEVHAYIFHRLQVAGCQRMLFTPKAVSFIHAISTGIPRLINLICDRALLGAYGLEQQTVDKKIAQAAAAEALGEEYQLPSIWQRLSNKKLALYASITSALVVVVVISFLLSSSSNDAETVIDNNTNVVLEEPIATANAADIANSKNLPTAFVRLFQLWHVSVDETVDKPCEIARDFQLSCYWYKGTFNGLLTLKYPAVFKFVDESGSSFYAAFIGKSNVDGAWLFDFAGNERVVDLAWLNQYWQGSAAILWQSPPDFEGEIDQNSNAALIQWLENTLSFKQNRPARVVSKFDKLLSNQLMQFQRNHGLEANGAANEKTVLLLSNTIEAGLPVFSL